MKLRARLFTIAISVFAAGFGLLASPEARASGERGGRCEAAFSGLSLGGASTSAELFVKLNQNTAKLRHLLYRYSGDQVGNEASNQDLRKSAQLALQLLRMNGAQAKLIQYEGFVAVEIVADPKLSNGWNRMATSLQQNYGTRLIYAPHSLVLHSTEAKYDRDTQTILISHESLSVGRAERRTLHEVGHMKSDHTKEESPNIFSGFIEVAINELVDGKPAAVALGTTDYVEGQDLDEVARFAQDLDRLGRDIFKSDSETSRSELSFVAKRGQDILANAREALAHASKISLEVSTELHQSGPVLLEDGAVAATRAYVAVGKETQITIERFIGGTLRVRLEDARLSSEIWVKEESDWSSLTLKLQRNERAAKREFAKRFTNLVQHWENELKPSLNALSESSRAIISKGTTMSASELSALAKAPRAIVAPHLRRAPR